MPQFVDNARRTNPRTTSFVLTVSVVVASVLLCFLSIRLFLWLAG